MSASVEREVQFPSNGEKNEEIVTRNRNAEAPTFPIPEMSQERSRNFA